MHRGVWVIVTTTIVAVAAIVVAPSAGSPQPAVAATTPSEFWLSFLPQYDAVTANQHVPELHLSTTTPTTVTVSGTAVGADIVVALAQVDQVHVVTLPASAVLADTEGTQAAGLRIQADHPITVHGSVRRGSNHAAFLALPTDQLGNRHRVLTAPGAGAMFAVVATQDATTLTITPRVALGTRNANTTFTVALNAGQVYVLRSLPANDTDPTGTLVTSDRPVAVMAGHTCSSFVTAGCSAVAEQLPPVSRWGTDTVMARLPRFDADSNAGEAIRVVADTDNTEVFVDGVRVATLAAGQTHASYRFAGLTSAQPVVGGRVTTSAAALVATFAAQGVHHGLGAGRMGGSAFTVLAPVTQLARRVVVSPLAPSLTGYGATIALPTSAVSSLRLNGAEVPAQSFTALGATTWSAGHVTLSAASHVITAHQAMAVTVWGVGAPASGYGAVAARTLASDADEPPPTTTTITTTTTTTPSRPRTSCCA